MQNRLALRRVVLAHDGSTPPWVLDRAAALATTVRVPLHLACAVDGAAASAARDRVRLAAAAVRSRVVDVTTSVQVGSPGAVLLPVTRPGDLLVVGAHDRRLPGRLLLGSVSSRLVGAARVSVLVVRAREPGDGPVADGPVVVGVDGSPSSAHAVRAAGQLARERGVPVHVLTAVVPPLHPAGAATRRCAQLLDAAGALVAAAAAALADEHPGLVVTSSVERADPVLALMAASRTAGTVVVGSRGGCSAAGATLGSVSRAVSFSAACSVLVVRCPDDAGVQKGARDRGAALAPVG